MLSASAPIRAALRLLPGLARLPVSFRSQQWNLQRSRFASQKAAPRSVAQSIDRTPARRLLRQSLGFLSIAASVALVGHIVLEHFYSVNLTFGISMLPTLNSSGDWVITSKYYRRGRGVVVGNVINFQHPVLNERVVKRVVGMPGDFVLEGTPDAENPRMIQVPQGHCWVTGDNLSFSRDSRHYGPMPLGLVIGKVIGAFETKKGFPWARFKSVENVLLDHVP